MNKFLVRLCLGSIFILLSACAMAQTTPTITVSLARPTMPQGEWNVINIHSSCNSACDTGILYVNGNAYYYFNLDSNGNALVYLNTSAVSQIQQYTLTASTAGNGAWAAATASAALNVIADTLPVPAIKITPVNSSVPQGQPDTLTVNVSCGSGCSVPGLQGLLSVNGQPYYYFVPDGNGNATISIDQQTLSQIGNYSLEADYFGNDTWAPTSATTSISVVANTLPTPTISVSPSRPTVPQGEWNVVNIHSSCNTACGSGLLSVNGAGYSYFVFDSSGNAFLYLNASAVSQIEQYTLDVSAFGDNNWAAASGSGSLNVVADNLPSPTVSITPSTLAVPQGQPDSVTVHVSCDINCGVVGLQGLLSVNGQPFYYFVPDSNGNAMTYIDQQTLSQLGSYSLEAVYFGNDSWAPASATTSISVVANTLPVPTISVAPSRTSIPQGEWNLVTIHSSCDTSCGGGTLSVNGSIYTYFTFDDSGTTVQYLNAAAVNQVQQYTLTASAFGTSSWAAAAGSASLNVIADNLPIPAMSITPTSSTISQNQLAMWTPVVIHLSCGAGCSVPGLQGLLTVNGNPYDYFTPDSSGNATVYLDHQTLSSVGTYALEGQYFGNDSWAPAAAAATVTIQASATNGPQISSLTPTYGFLGSQVTLNGSNLGSLSTTTVTLNGTPMQIISVAPSQVTVAIRSTDSSGEVVVNVGSQSSNGLFVMVNSPPLCSIGFPN